MSFADSLDLIFSHIDIFLEGIGMTLLLTAISLVCGLVIAVAGALSQVYRIPYAHRIVSAYVYVFRGSPLLVQLYLIYYGSAQFQFIRESFLWVIFSEPFWCALIAFSLNTGAYTTAILRGAIEATPKGEIEAALACGMSRLMQIRRIILPSSFRRALPVYSNEIIFTLHGSALASTVQIMDILGAGRWLNGRYYVTFEGFISAGVIYALLTIAIVIMLRPLEAHWTKHIRSMVR